jgi:hypothetical protein
MLGRLLTLCALVGVLATVYAASSPGATSTDGRIVRLNGKPFFPLMLIDQCSGSDVAHARALGINLILNEACAGVSAQRQLEMITGKSLAVLPIRSDHIRGGGLVGWTYPDEPENNHWTPESLRNSFADPGNDGLVSFLTTAGGFFRAPYRDNRVDRGTYSEFARLADIAGFDLYPLGHCQTDLSAVFDAQREFVALAGRRPTFQWIETGPIKPEYCGGFKMTPAQLRAEVWLAIVGGARGIGFFTHTWTPNENAFDVSPELQHMMKRLTQLINDVHLGILGTTIASGSNSGAIKTLARTTADRTFVFGVNAESGYTRVQVLVPDLRDGALTVYGENRAVQVHDHRFIDTFTPLAAHVYVQRR